MSAKVDSHDYVASMLRTFYVRKMEESRNGRTYKFPSRFQGMELWRKAAALCLDLEADPEQFIAASFKYCTIPVGPMPTMLGGAAARKWWAEYKRMHNTAKVEVMSIRTGEAVEVEIEAYTSIQNALKVARSVVNNYKGTMELNSMAALETMKSPMGNGIPEYLKVLLFPNDLEILAANGSAAYKTLQSRAIHVAAEALGFDVEQAKIKILDNQ